MFEEKIFPCKTLAQMLAGDIDGAFARGSSSKFGG
jgi:hypothetical protein